MAGTLSRENKLFYAARQTYINRRYSPFMGNPPGHAHARPITLYLCSRCILGTALCCHAKPMEEAMNTQIPKATPEEAAGSAPVTIRVMSCKVPIRGWYRNYIGKDFPVTQLQVDGYYILWKDYINKSNFKNRLFARKDVIMLWPKPECAVCRNEIKKGQPIAKLDDLPIHKTCAGSLKP